MTDSAKVETFAARQRRKYRHTEFSEQVRLTKLLTQYLPDNVFWSALSNAPRTALAGYLARLRGVRSGLTDIIVVYDGRVIWVEMKSPAGVASKVQRQVCAELQAAGADWYLARSAEAALAALRLSNVPFRHPWTPPPLEPWEGPFDGAMICSGKRLPQAPEVAAQRRAAQRAWRERRRVRNATQHPTARPHAGPQTRAQESTDWSI
jgi:VRR-NUC domain